MKKVLALLSLVMVASIFAGCGNSPDGDAQRLSTGNYIIR